MPATQLAPWSTARMGHRLGSTAALLASLMLAGCSLLPLPGPQPDSPAPGTDPHITPGLPQLTEQTPAIRAWRKQAAQHIYKKYPQHLYKGKIPPLVYAVVVVETHLDAQGHVRHVSYSRTPSHAPEVPPQIEALIRAASPFPAPSRIGAHTYVDTWLWDKSGRFQLDTLTEGQRSR